MQSANDGGGRHIEFFSGDDTAFRQHQFVSGVIPGPFIGWLFFTAIRMVFNPVHLYIAATTTDALRLSASLLPIKRDPAFMTARLVGVVDLTLG